MKVSTLCDKNSKTANRNKYFKYIKEKGVLLSENEVNISKNNLKRKFFR